MELPFLDRKRELARLKAFLKRSEGSLAVLYGRRRCGKSRLLQEAVSGPRTVYYLADERESAIQRSALAGEIARLLEGFDEVQYLDWTSLLDRWWKEAPSGAVLIVDEFPYLVAAASELPSLLQKYMDTGKRSGVHLVLCGSSQRMMQGLVLNESAPLFGRATEIIKITPLEAGWVCDAFDLPPGPRAIEYYSVWGGVPRYWELAREYKTLREAVGNLALDPQGVLHDEPKRLLRDDLREVAGVSSILALIGQGCNRPSEIAGRLQKQATSLSRPLQRLLDLDLIRRERPFETSLRDTKRTLYKIADPFLRFWFRYIEANRSRLEAHQMEDVARDIETSFAEHVSGVWEELVRAGIARGKYFGISWRPAQSWWGTGIDRSPMQIDVVSESADRNCLLIGEAKWSARTRTIVAARELDRKIKNAPFVHGRKVYRGLWLKRGASTGGSMAVFTSEETLKRLR